MHHPSLSVHTVRKNLHAEASNAQGEYNNHGQRLQTVWFRRRVRDSGAVLLVPMTPMLKEPGSKRSN